MLKKQKSVITKVTDWNLEYTLTRSHRKTLSIRVLKNAQVEVKAPLGLKLGFIEDFLRQKKSFIDKHVSNMQKKEESKKIHQDKIMFLGVYYPYLLSPFHKNKLVFEESHFTFYYNTKEDSPEVKLKELIEVFYKSQAQDIFKERLILCIARARDFFDFKTPTLKMRKMKRRFGSMNQKGVLTLNTSLVKFSLKAIDMVVYHELTHIKHFHHQKEFYDLLEKLEPDYKKIEKDIQYLI